MRMRFIYLLLALLCAGSFACEMEDAEPELDMDALRATIQSMEDRYARHQNNGEADSLRFYYADDVVSYGPEEPVVTGIDALMAAIKEDMESDTSDSAVGFELVDLFAENGMAVEIGSVTVSDRDGDREVGHYMCVFKKQDDGSWRVIREMYNDRFDRDEEDDEGDEAEEN